MCNTSLILGCYFLKSLCVLVLLPYFTNRYPVYLNMCKISIFIIVFDEQFTLHQICPVEILISTEFLASSHTLQTVIISDISLIFTQKSVIIAKNMKNIRFLQLTEIDNYRPMHSVLVSQLTISIAIELFLLPIEICKFDLCIAF